MPALTGQVLPRKGRFPVLGRRSLVALVAVTSLFLTANAALLVAQVNSFSEGVICRTNRTLLQRGSEWTP